jgi:hypothetical protein
MFFFIAISARSCTVFAIVDNLIGHDKYSRELRRKIHVLAFTNLFPVRVRACLIVSVIMALLKLKT